MAEIIGVTKPSGAKCPDCNKRPCTFEESPMQFPATGAVYSQVICHDCGHVFAVAFIGARSSAVQQVAVMPPSNRRN